MNFSRNTVSLFAVTMMGTFFLLATAFATGLFADEPREQLWQEYQQAMDAGLPQTAIDKLQPIVDQALADQAYAEAIKAMAQKINLQSQVQSDRSEERLIRMREAIAGVPPEMRPVMEAILANWYWAYFGQNRWRFMERTRTAVAPGDDIATWDLARILAEVNGHFDKALESSDVLQKIPIAQYDAILEKGTAPDSHRPTIYDFLANEAIEFYSAGEQAGTESQDAFELNADSPIFASQDDFISWNPSATDTDSPTLRAIRLYQELIRFHQSDDDRTAFLDADLSRLRFGNNFAYGEEKTARFRAALKRFADRNANHPISSLALADLAGSLQEDGDFVEAHHLASMGMNRFPDTVGARRCFNLIQLIEARSSQVTTERVWNKPLPTIDVRYRNVTKIYFRVVPLNFHEYMASQRWESTHLDLQQRQRLLAQSPTKAWSTDLPQTKDFKERVERIVAPEDLEPGSYFLIASHNERFDEAENQISLTDFWVSDLALVIRAHESGTIEGFVLNANSGEPLTGVTVQAWKHDRNGQRQRIDAVTTDKSGIFRMPKTENFRLWIHASHQGHAVASSHAYYAHRNDRVTPRQQQTVFFTDRAIYRPGQTIQYKGLCLDLDPSRDHYQAISRQRLSVVFQDSNGVEIERTSHITNDYGSFSGSVTAPRDRLMGQMLIRVDGGPDGMASVTIEEYKRPKFEVVLNAPGEPTKVNSRVKLTGKAAAYTGASIDDAVVRWRVVREVQFPIWWQWGRPWFPSFETESQEIAHGATATSTDGTFTVDFLAKPDPKADEEAEPIFHFKVYADVIDRSGETRSTHRTINVGFTALKATVEADVWQTEDQAVELSLNTRTIDDEATTAVGVLKIHAVVQPDKVTRAPLSNRFERPWEIVSAEGDDVEPADPTDINHWPLGDVVNEQTIRTDATGKAKISVNLPPGVYRAKYEARDQFGKVVRAELPIRVIDVTAKKLPLKLPNLVVAKQSSWEPGEEFLVVWGSGYDNARAYVEIDHRGKLLQSFWTAPGDTQVAIKQKIDESMRGGFNLRITMVRENRAYLHSETINVPWSNKRLTLQWKHFVSKLGPADKETWTLAISGPDAKQAAAELVATMYDASLDAFQRHEWIADLSNVFRVERDRVRSQFENVQNDLRILASHWTIERQDDRLTYRSFPPELINGRRGGLGMGYGAVPRAMMAEGVVGDMAMAPAMMAPGGRALSQDTSSELATLSSDGTNEFGPPSNQSDVSNLDQVSPRKNLNETAFFFPHLIAGEDGVVKIEFTMPEALTRWKFLAFAHDKSLRAGLLTDKVITAKDLMVQPNPPRFLREGDVIEFTTKVSNQSPTRQAGTVRLTFFDTRTNTSVDNQLDNSERDQSFDIAAGESTSVAWRLSVPDGMGTLKYTAIGSTDKLSDGEEGYLPMLPRRVLVTESLPLPIRGKQTKTFELRKLSESGSSHTLRHQSLTVQMTSNPSWYAVMSLPYLMEYPHDCSEQTFSRLYANLLARHVASSDPKIHRTFDQWRATPALDSPLEKNEDLKSVLLEETPWVRQAASESQSRRNIGILFDDNRLNDETARLLVKLKEMQLDNGAWPWFPGGRANDYITLYITTGFGRLRHLGVNVDSSSAIASLSRLDEWIMRLHKEVPAKQLEKNHLSNQIALYLYGRSFFLDEQPIDNTHQEAVNYWLGQAKSNWLELRDRQPQAHLAIALKRFGDSVTPQKIMASIKEHSLNNEEMGMYWPDNERSWWWYRAPIETQALLIEAFDEVMDDQVAVEDCKVWLLKQKQTQSWRTTKATADAVYALLLRGTDNLASNQLVEVSLGGNAIRSEAVEAGTGFYQHRFMGADVNANQGRIVVKKIDDGVAWGSVHWQYFEDMRKLTPYEGTPLTLTKELYTKEASKQGPVLEKVEGALEVGDELVVRMVLRTDRDMEYVHLKDYRGSGTEPVNVLSQYKFQDGLAYYESTRDTASHFFIDYLPKGTYVFEYSTRVQLRGSYQTGAASVECMYAPEFGSHSDSLMLEVK